MQSRENGNAVAIVLAVVLVAAVGVGGWLYMNRPADVALADPAVQTPADEVAPAPVPETNAGVAPAPETTPAPETDAAKIDLDAAMAPRTVGDANAPIKIIEYASLTCSHCADFHNKIFPELKTKYIDTGKVFFVYREFPLNDPALKAAIAARCLPADKYGDFVAMLFQTQASWGGGLDYMAALKRDAGMAGLSPEMFEACQADPQLKLKLAEGMQIAQDKYQITSTPTFIINDGAEKIGGAAPLTEFERVFRIVSNNTIGEAPAVTDSVPTQTPPEEHVH